MARIPAAPRRMLTLAALMQRKSAQRLIRIKAASEEWPDRFRMEWQAISTAPFDRALELAVIDSSGVHTLVFPCRHVLRGWIKAETSAPVDVHPTHWRDWDDSVNPARPERES